MPLESLGQEAHINIKNVSTETPEKEWRLHFDPKRNITAEEWEGMVRTLEGFRVARNWRGFLPEAATIVTLDRSKLPPLTDGHWRDMLSEFERERSDAIVMPSFAADIMAIDPSKLPALNYRDWERTIDYLNSQREQGFSLNTARAASNIVKIDRSKLPRLNEKDWQGVLSELQLLEKKENWLNFTVLAAEIAVIDVSKLHIAESHWATMLAELERQRHQNSSLAGGYLQSKLTELSRLVDVNPASLSSSSTSLPQTRNF